MLGRVHNKISRRDILWDKVRNNNKITIIIINTHLLMNILKRVSNCKILNKVRIKEEKQRGKRKKDVVEIFINMKLLYIIF